MGRKAITQEIYDALIEGWRLNQENAAAAGRYAGADYRTAQKAYDEGWPRRGWEPIRLVIERDMQKARAAMLAEAAAKAAAEEKQRDDAAKQAAQSRAQEGQMVNLSKGTALQALSTSAQLAAGARALAGLVSKRLQAEAQVPDGDPKQMTAGQGTYLLHRVADTMMKINGLAHEAMVMERLHLGEPGQIMAMKSHTEMTMEEAEMRIAAASQALEQAKRVGGLRVIDGGMKEPVLGKRVTG